jgi:putative ABC transport system ATP-binding protein
MTDDRRPATLWYSLEGPCPLPPPLLAADDLEKTYVTGDSRVVALAGVSLELASGDFVALMGPSGCGKSTLLHLCGAMDRPTRGRVRIEGRDISVLDDDERTRVRRERIGFVFQFFNLLPTLTVGDNIALPCLLAGMRGRDAEARAAALATRVGIAHRLAHYPQQVSGGEMQRAAIARALVHQPALLIADEPTGNLDSENGTRVLALLRELNEETGVTMLLATHAQEVAAAATRVHRMRAGGWDLAAVDLATAEPRIETRRS